MGKAQKALKSFIEGIPASKLEKISSGPGTLYKNSDFRLDMQGVSGTHPSLPKKKHH
jgi:hypothetical protein